MSNSLTTYFLKQSLWLFSPTNTRSALTPAPANNTIVCRPSAATGSLFGQPVTTFGPFPSLLHKLGLPSLLQQLRLQQSPQSLDSQALPNQLRGVECSWLHSLFRSPCLGIQVVEASGLLAGNVFGHGATKRFPTLFSSEPREKFPKIPEFFSHISHLSLIFPFFPFFPNFPKFPKFP